jgi:anti-anti-sigma regulatory factor
VLELTEVHALEGGDLGMLIYLQRWARDHNIRFKLFNPSKSVRERLELVSSLSEFDIPTLDEMMALLASADKPIRDGCLSIDFGGSQFRRPKTASRA